MMTTYEMQEFDSAAKLVFDGERFVSLARIADMLRPVLSQSAPLRMEDVSLTAILLQGSDVALLLDVSFEADETVLSLWLTHEDDDMAGVAALMASICHCLSRSLPVGFVVWGENGPRIPRDAYVAALTDVVLQPEISPPAAIPCKPVTVTTLQDLLPGDAAPPEPARQGAGSDQHRSRATARGDRRPDAPTDRHQSTLRPTRHAPVAQDDCEGEIQAPTTEARLSVWALSLSAAMLSWPVAAPVMAYNIVRGEDMRAAALTLGLAGFFFALNTHGTLAARF